MKSKKRSDGISELEALKQTIVFLENKQAHEYSQLKEHFHVAFESLKPVNLIKKTLSEVSASPDIKDNILNNAIGLTTGYLSRKVLLGSSLNPVKNILGTVLQFAVANIVSKHTDNIKSTGSNILQRIFKSRARVKLDY